MCCVCMTSNARSCSLVGSLLDASSTGVSDPEVPGCASGVQPLELGQLVSLANRVVLISQKEAECW